MKKLKQKVATTESAAYLSEKLSSDEVVQLLGHQNCQVMRCSSCLVIKIMVEGKDFQQ